MNITIRGELPKEPTAKDIVDLLLYNRGLIESRAKKEFLNPPHPISLTLTDFGFTHTYVTRAIKQIWMCHPLHPLNKSPDKPIIVYTDYDADGITGGVILWETLHLLGFRVFPYVPNRISEGYGFSTRGLDRVKAKYDPALVISVDHGIVADSQITYSSHHLGIPVLVTDHHTRQEEKIPKHALAIFHIPALSGSGVAYYVAKEIFANANFQFPIPNTDKLSKLFLNDYVGIATIGTVADLVPLRGPSRNIVFHGLPILTSTERVGVQALKHVAGHIGKKVTTYEVGFLLAPRINASGRLEDALDSLRLLCTNDPIRAQQLAEKLNNLNITRQNMVRQAVEEAIAMVEAQKDKDGTLPKILFVFQDKAPSTVDNVEDVASSELHRTQDSRVPYAEEFESFATWHEGIIGLIASKICEKYYRPTIVLTRSGDSKEGIYKASCRSIAGFHMTEFLNKHKDMLLKFGGHEAAAGFSIDGHHLEHFIQKALNYADTHIAQEMMERSISVDCQLSVDAISMDLAKEIENLAPFGMGNPRPTFQSKGHITDVHILGKDRRHLQFLLTNQIHTIEVIAFGKSDQFESISSNSTEREVTFTIDINRWNGSEKVQTKMIYMQ